MVGGAVEGRISGVVEGQVGSVVSSGAAAVRSRCNSRRVATAYMCLTPTVHRFKPRSGRTRSSRPASNIFFFLSDFFPLTEKISVITKHSFVIVLIVEKIVFTLSFLAAVRCMIQRIVFHKT